MGEEMDIHISIETDQPFFIRYCDDKGFRRNWSEDTPDYWQGIRWGIDEHKPEQSKFAREFELVTCAKCHEGIKTLYKHTPSGSPNEVNEV